MTRHILDIGAPAAIVAPAPAREETIQTGSAHAPLIVSGKHMLFANAPVGDTATQQMMAACAHELGKMLTLVPEELTAEAALGIMTRGFVNGRRAEAENVPFSRSPRALLDFLPFRKDAEHIADAASSRVYTGVIPPVAVGYYIRTAIESVFGSPVIKSMLDDGELARTTFHGWVHGGFNKAAFSDRLLSPEQLADILCESLIPREGHAYLPLPTGKDLEARRKAARGWLSDEDLLRGANELQFSEAAREMGEVALFVAQHVLDGNQSPRPEAQRTALVAYSHASVLLQGERAELAARRERVLALSAITTTWPGDGGARP